MAGQEENRRRDPRQLCASLVEIALPQGAPGSIMGVVEDISERGLCLSVELALRTGSEVVLPGLQPPIPATVRHCFPDEAGSYHIGLEFQPGYEWATDDEWPEHRV